jgi:hypothetical protein
MLLYEIKLIHPHTHEVIYESLTPRPQLPPAELQKKFAGAILIINTRDAIPVGKCLEENVKSKIA